jgi:hypothetical protein
MRKMKNGYKILVGKKLKGRDRLEDIGIDGGIIVKCKVIEWSENVWSFFHLAQDNDQQRACINLVMNLQVQ